MDTPEAVAELLLLAFLLPSICSAATHVASPSGLYVSGLSAWCGLIDVPSGPAGAQARRAIASGYAFPRSIASSFSWPETGFLEAAHD